MLKQLMTAPGVIEFREVPLPDCKDDEVMVKILKIGICGSDIHVYHGEHPFTSYPVTQGHEVSAEIVKTGGNVKEFTIGQKVTIMPQVVCKKCYPCTHGNYNLCEELKVMGFQTEGAAAHYLCVDQEKLMLLPEDMSDIEGAMIEPLAVAVHAAKKFKDMKGAGVVVLGAGPIGILVAQAAKGFGAKNVLITDVSDLRLEKAKECGIEHVLNTKRDDLGRVIEECFGPDKADVIYDCAGNDITIGQAIRFARKGSTIILVAVFAGIAKVDLAVLNDHELKLDSSMMYRREDYEDAINLVTEHKVALKPLVSKQFPFHQYADAYRYIDENRESTMKVMIDVQEDT